jgi:chromosome segregation ATPase
MCAGVSSLQAVADEIRKANGWVEKLQGKVDELGNRKVQLEDTVNQLGPDDPQHTAAQQQLADLREELKLLKRQLAPALENLAELRKKERRLEEKAKGGQQV